MQNLDMSVWVLNNLLVFEKQIRKISGSIQCKEGWRMRSNKLQKSIQGEDNVKYIKV